MNSCFYYMTDDKTQKPFAIECHPLEAPKKNKERYGIFWTIHEFSGARQKQNLTAINGFAVDIDTDDKIGARENIRKGLYPTFLVETKRGWHCYWLFKEPLITSYNQELDDLYKHTMTKRLIPFYGADPKASDLCRLLRVPYFLHWKDPNDPFMVRVESDNEVFYDWKTIDRFYPNVADNALVNTHKQATVRSLKLGKKGDDFFRTIGNLNCKDALEALSGHASVGGELYSFRRNTAGSEQILVNGKSTSCWIDIDGKIGSYDKGGPTIWQWLFWHLSDHKKVYEVVKEVLGVE